MSWLTPIGFLGLIGLIALIIIYIIKPNYQNKIISSTFIWKLSLKLRKKQIPISKLRNILLFICQVLAITTLAFILAQPVIAAQQEEENTEKVVIIDASASMFATSGNTTRFERAVESVRILSNEIFENEGKITVILASEKASVLASGVSAENKDLVFDALDSLIDPSNLNEPITYASGDVESAIKLAEEKTSVNPDAEVYLYTDTKYIDHGNVVIKDVKDPSEWNASILDVRAIVDENYYRFEVDVACFGGVDADIDVYLNIYGTNSDKVSMSLGATARCIGGETTTLVFAKNPENELSPEENGIDQELTVFSYEYATVEIEENDSFEYDNSFELHGGAKPSLRIQYASSSPNNFFATALLVLRDTLSKRWDVEFVELKEDEEPENEGFDFYIFEHTIPKTLPSDGVIILANPDSIPSIAGVHLGRRYNTYDSQQVPLSAEETEHPLMHGINAGQITVTQFTEITNADGYSTLMSVDSTPVVVAKNEPDQKIVVMSFSLNYSNFSMLLEFPLFMYNIFGYYSPSTFTEHVYEVNDTISLNSRSDALFVTNSDQTVTEITEFPQDHQLKKPGLYTVSQTPISGETVSESFFVKMPDSECNIAEVVDTLSNPYYAAKEELADLDLLLYFALALVALLFIEWWLQSREQF